MFPAHCPNALSEMMRLAIFIGVVILVAGCGLLPEVSRQPNIHNPFPQLTKVAVAPFINLSTDPSVDGRQFGLAYFAELQLIPGFEVVPIGVVETAMRDNHLTLNSAADCRRLAQLLGVDAIVVGAVTDFDPYYPPRCGMQVEWYAANPGFHSIPPGYGLPWGTPAEEDIPQSLVLETEMSLARAQLKTQTPTYEKEPPAALPARRTTVDDDAVRQAQGQSPSVPSTADGEPRQAAKTTTGTAGSATSTASNQHAKTAAASNQARSDRFWSALARAADTLWLAAQARRMVCRPIGPIRAGWSRRRRRPCGRNAVRPTNRCCDIRELIMGPTPNSRPLCEATRLFATTPDSAAGPRISSGATTLSASAVTSTSPKC